MNLEEARAVAIAVDGLRDESRVFGQEVEGEMAGDAQIVPREIEVKQEGDALVHLGERNIEALGEGSFGVVTKTVREALGSSNNKYRKYDLVAQKKPHQWIRSEDNRKQLNEAKIAMELSNIP